MPLSFIVTPIFCRSDCQICSMAPCSATPELKTVSSSRFDTPACCNSDFALLRSNVYVLFFSASYAGELGLHWRSMGWAKPWKTCVALRCRSMA